jgi:hypothetical protein
MLYMVRRFLSIRYGAVCAAVPVLVDSLPLPTLVAAFLYVAFLPLSAFAGQSLPQDVTVVRSDARTLVLEYQPRFGRVDTVTAGNRTYLRLDFAESAQPDFRTAAGGPDLRFRVLPIGFPSDAGNSVRVIASDFEEFRGIDLLPVPQVAIGDGMLHASAYMADAEKYGRSGLSPASIIELETPRKVRSVTIGGLKLWPVQADPSARLVRKYSRIVVEITFGGQSASPVDPRDAALLGPAVVNGDMLELWKQPSPQVRKTTLTSSVLASGDWYRMAVTQEGIYRIDAQYLNTAGINVSSVDPRTIKIYGNGGQEVPENLTLPRPADLTENALYVEGESDGQFGATDYVLFYARSPRGWTYDSTASTLRHYINHYTETNYYWLTFGGTRGKRMTDQPSLTGSPTVAVEKFLDGVFVEEEKVNKLGSGKDWYGQSLSGPSSSFTHVNALPGLAANETITYRFTLVAHDEVAPRFTVREGSTVLGVYNLPPVYQYQYASADTREATGTSSLAGNSSQLNFAFSSPSLAAEGWIDWVEILYPRMLWGVSDYLRFRSPKATGVAEYRLQQFSVRPWIFNVSDPASVRLVSGVSGSYVFLDSLRGGRVTEYCAAGLAAWKAPGVVQKISNQDLRGYAAGADFIIVTSQEFRAAADRLKVFREKPESGGLRTIVVDVSQIYNEFGGGLPDITAIRDYLKYAYDTWTPRPVFTLLLGGASYDYKGILGTKSSFVPTWQSPESRNDVDSYATDDFFAKFAGGDAISLVLGRISSRNLAEANTVVDKIIRYEEQSVRDSWRMRMLYIGDDAWTPEGGEEGDRTIHSDDAETLANPLYTPGEFEKKKIYIAEYPTAFTAEGRRKPGAAQEIIDQINQGVLIANYSGHGNPKVWAHEQIFEVTTSIPQLQNADRLALFFLATCNFSQYDNPTSYTGSELLLNKSEGGAIGVISASRKVYAGANAALNQGTYRRMFGRDAFGRVSIERPATALFLFKAGYNFENDQKFFYMGDPTTRLAYPRGYATIDSINGEGVDSIHGQPRSAPIQMNALSMVTVKGTVRDADNKPDQNFTGTLSLRVNDVSRTQLIVNFYPGLNWPYISTGGTIYRGENSVVRGQFKASFVVPKDISYADTTGRGRLVAYYWNAAGDGAGFTSDIRIGGTDSGAVPDHEGPAMQVYLDSRNFRPGDMVSERPTLLVDLRDSSGINTSTTAIGHRIEAWVNNSLQSKDLTDAYTSRRDDFREGTVQSTLTGLAQGRNSIRVRAWDSYNNSASAETFFQVASSDNLTITDVFPYPNPFADATAFTFRHNQNGPLDVEVKVYTLAGRLVQSLKQNFTGDRMVQLPWDGRDRDGDVLANGVYLYKLIVRTADGRFASEALGKMSVLR